MATEYNVEYLESLINLRKKEAIRVIQEINTLQGQLNIAKEFRRTHVCKLNKSCHLWECCWNRGKSECGNCTSFETASQYNERMNKAYEEMRQYHY